MTAKSTAKKMNPFKRFTKEALEEYGKITWPTNEQTILLTGITMAVSTLVVLLIGTLDLGFNELYQLALDNLK